MIIEDLCTRIGWSLYDLARHIGVSRSAVEHWVRGKNAHPHGLIEWLEGIAAYLDVHPAPAGRLRGRPQGTNKRQLRQTACSGKVNEWR